MADDTASKEATAKAAGKAKADADAEARPAESAPADDLERNTVEGWKERARTRFGDSPHAVAGALHDADAEATFTEAEVSSALQAFHAIEHEPEVVE